MKTSIRKLNINRTINKNKIKKEEIILTRNEFNNLLKEIAYYKKTIEELQDELDTYESEQIKKTTYQTVKFDINDYVSDRARKISAKNIKKPSTHIKRKNSKINK